VASLNACHALVHLMHVYLVCYSQDCCLCCSQ